MKGGNKTLTIIAIVVNAIFLAGLLFGMSMYGARAEGRLDKVGLIFILVFPAVTLITIALTFRKEGKKLASVLRIIAVIVNVLFLIILISAMVLALERLHNQDFAQWLVCILGLGLPVLNLVALALTFRKTKDINAVSS